MSLAEYQMGHEDNRVKKLVNDIKVNGLFYLKNNVTVRELQEHDSNIKAYWDKHEGLYVITYERG